MGDDNRPRVYEEKPFWLMNGHKGTTIAVPRDGRWTFNGDMVKPTFSPSVLEYEGHHMFIRDGVVQYLSDKRDNSCCVGEPEFFEIPPWNEDD